MIVGSLASSLVGGLHSGLAVRTVTTCGPSAARNGMLTSLAEQFGTYFGDWLDPQLGLVLLGVILAAVLGTTILFTASAVMYTRRRTTRHLLVVVILGILVARSIVGIGTVFGITPMVLHHLIEHGFDFLIALIILYAVYRSRSLPANPV